MLLLMLLAGSVTQVDAKTIYYLNEHDWSTPKIYLYNSGGGQLKAWPGSDMTKTDKVYDGHDIYQFEYDESLYDVCIFNQGNDTDKTDDLTIGTGDFYVKDSWENWANFHESRSIYLNAGAVDWWCNGSAIQKATFKPSNTTVTGTLVSGNIYEFIMPAGFYTYTTVSFGRYETEDSATPWNSTGDITIDNTKNYVKTFEEDKETATWGNYPTYTITYNLNGGTNPADAPNEYDGTSAITLPKPTKTDYVFNDWFDNAELTGSAVRKITVGSTGNKEFWAKWDEPVWRIVGLGVDNWENPIENGIALTNAYGSVYYYHYDGSASSTFRVACGSQQYHTNGVTVPSTGETQISLTARIKGAGDQTSITIPEACYICINADTKKVWLQSTVPTHEIYFDAAVLNWMTANPVFKIKWYNDNNQQVGTTTEMEKVNGYSATYKATAPSDATKMQVLRHDPAYPNNDPWNQTAITPIDDSHDFYYATGWESTKPLGAKDSGAIDITLNIYWNMTATSTGNFNSWIYGGEHWTQYTNGSSAEWYVAPGSSNPDNRPYSTTDQINGTDWYKVTLYFTGVNATNEVARLGVGSSSNLPTDDNYITMEDIVLSSYKTPGTYNVYYYNGNIVADPDVSDYYLIIKNATKSETISYKMSDGRFRVVGVAEKYKDDAGMLSKRYFTRTVKSEWLFPGVNYCYIANDADGTQVFARPSETDVELTFSGSDLYGVSGYKKQTSNTVNTGDNYFVLNNKNTTNFKSYVFDIAVKADKHPLDVYANGSIDITYGGQKQDSYYVIGNFGNTVSANEQMHPYDDKYTKLMEKYYYRNGLASADVIADADSIVYKLEVNRPDNGWGELYLMFAPAGVISQWKSDKSDDHWRETIRPQVNYDNVDATALEGGLIYSNNHFLEAEPKDMSINPLLSEAQKYRYVAYTVYLNVTTSTYRIEFHDEYYLAGPAVSEESYMDRIKLEIVTDEGSRSHYKYTGRFTKGQKFLVYSNHESLGFYFHEDGDVIGIKNNVSSVDDVVAPSTKEKDFDFFNHMKYEQAIGRDKPDTDRAFTFNLPTGEYTIRFYDLAEDVNGTPFYTIDKVVTLKNATSTSSDDYGTTVTDENENFGGGWRTYSDDVATYIPDGVKAYYVDKAKNGKIHLKELTKIIPAHCGVLLHNPNLTETEKSYNLIPVVEDNLFITSLEDREGYAAENLLVDCYQVGEVTDGIATTTSVKVGPGNNVDGYNYFFTNKITASVTRKTTDASGKEITVTNKETLITPMNFWRSNGNASRKKTYLHVDSEITPAYYSNGSFSFDDSEFTDQNEAKSYCFVMTFSDIDDTEDMPVITTVESVRSVNDTETYYNIQGMKVDKPTHGLYIKNGKKIYIK